MTESSGKARYGIIINPSAGRAGINTKRRVIAECARILGGRTLVAGWKTETPEELRALAREMAAEVDVLAVAGGDGTISDIINAVASETVLAYLPMGSGNAWRATLGLPRSREEIARRIRKGRVHEVDLVLVDESRKGLLASVGFEGHALNERRKLLDQGVNGFDAYLRATAKTVFGGYKGEDASVVLDGRSVTVLDAITLIVTKTPFYGYGIKVVPRAKLDDGLLHVLLVSGHPASKLSGVVTSISDGSLFGEYTTCKRVKISSEKERHLQVDGTPLHKGTDFTFRVLPAALKMRY
jgi:diacylglycerol kinase family enzyme